MLIIFTVVFSITQQWYLPTAREGNIFIGVCHSLYNRSYGYSVTAHPCYSTVDTHRTGMLSCYHFYTCLSFCSHGGLPGPYPLGRLRGLAGGLQPHTQGELWGSSRGREFPRPGGISRPKPGGEYPSIHWGRPPPPADGYCCGQYASYWNAFLLVTEIVLRSMVENFVSDSII